jgi:cephalosporin-C deacetylase-like acetyl esterase
VAAVLSRPVSSGNRAAVLYVNSAGQAAGVKAVQGLVEAGNVVMAIDPRGWGEGAAPPQVRGSSDWQIAQRAMLIGKPMLGMQTFDVLRAFDYLSTVPEVDATRIRIVGAGGGGLLALFAGALEPRIASVDVTGAPQSYMSIVDADIHHTPPGWLIPGVLKHFDLPDVIRAIAPRPVSVR